MGLLDKVKNLGKKVDSDEINRAADAVEKNVTDERVDQAMKRVPGGDKLEGKVPDNVGEKAADKMREYGGSDKDKSE